MRSIELVVFLSLAVVVGVILIHYGFQVGMSYEDVYVGTKIVSVSDFVFDQKQIIFVVDFSNTRYVNITSLYDQDYDTVNLYFVNGTLVTLPFKVDHSGMSFVVIVPVNTTLVRGVFTFEFRGNVYEKVVNVYTS